jgi:Imelysin
MRQLLRLSRAAVPAAVLALALLLAACGDDDDSGSEPEGSTAAESSADLGAIKGFLLEHTARLKDDTAEIRRGAESYHRLAKATGFDYPRLLRENRAEVRAFVNDAQTAFRRANPSYEEMEGVVAGVPELADYDVIIDAGGDASDPENAVPFDIETPDGRSFEQPGNFNYLIETAAFGTEPKFQAKGVKPDLDGDGRVEFGESVPDAGFYVAAAREFERYADELDAAAREWEPTPSDALTALVVMTPTMSEYFEAWKNSRFIAGRRASEKAFVAASRLQDIADILGGLTTVYAGVRPLVAEADRQQARQTGDSLERLHSFAAGLRDREARGREYTAEEADVLGARAQEEAEAIAGQITQAAAQLNIEIEEG